MFADTALLPCDAARIPAAQYGLNLYCPSKSTTCNARELACDLHYSEPKRAGMWISTTSRKSELQTAALYTWAVVHGLTMLVIDGLANVEQLSIERIAQKVVTTLRGLEGVERQQKDQQYEIRIAINGLYPVCSYMADGFIGPRANIECRH